MLFLVFFQLCSFNVYYFYLTIEMFFNAIIFFKLFFQVAFFCIKALLFLLYAVFAFGYFLGTL